MSNPEIHPQQNAAPMSRADRIASFSPLVRKLRVRLLAAAISSFVSFVIFVGFGIGAAVSAAQNSVTFKCMLSDVCTDPVDVHPAGASASVIAGLDVWAVICLLLTAATVWVAALLMQQRSVSDGAQPGLPILIIWSVFTLFQLFFTANIFTTHS